MTIIAINLQDGTRMRPGGRKLVELQALPETWAICEDLLGVVERHQKLEPLAVPANGLTHRLVEMTPAEKARADSDNSGEVRAEQEVRIRAQALAHLTRLLTDNPEALVTVLLGQSPNATALEQSAASAITDQARTIITDRDAEIARLPEAVVEAGRVR